jgi:hypothetical protein
MRVYASEKRVKHLRMERERERETERDITVWE